MEVRSTVKPETIKIRKKEEREDGIYFLSLVRWDIQKETIADEDGEEHTEFVYQEEEIPIRADMSIAISVDDSKDVGSQVRDYLDTNESEVVKTAQKKKALKKGKYQKYVLKGG